MRDQDTVTVISLLDMSGALYSQKRRGAAVPTSVSVKRALAVVQFVELELKAGFWGVGLLWMNDGADRFWAICAIGHRNRVLCGWLILHPGRPQTVH